MSDMFFFFPVKELMNRHVIIQFSLNMMRWIKIGYLRKMTNKLRLKVNNDDQLKISKVIIIKNVVGFPIKNIYSQDTTLTYEAFDV